MLVHGLNEERVKEPGTGNFAVFKSALLLVESPDIARTIRRKYCEIMGFKLYGRNVCLVDLRTGQIVQICPDFKWLPHVARRLLQDGFRQLMAKDRGAGFLSTPFRVRMPVFFVLRGGLIGCCAITPPITLPAERAPTKCVLPANRTRGVCQARATYAYMLSPIYPLFPCPGCRAGSRRLLGEERGRPGQGSLINRSRSGFLLARS